MKQQYFKLPTMQLKQITFVEAILLQHSIWYVIFMLLRNEFTDKVKKTTYFWIIAPFLSSSSSITSHILWSLHNLWRMCSCAQELHNGSGSSQVLQKCVALMFKFSKRQDSHKTSNCLYWCSLKKKTKKNDFFYQWSVFKLVFESASLAKQISFWLITVMS